MSYELSTDDYYAIVNSLSARAKKYNTRLNVSYAKINELYQKPRCEFTGVLFGFNGDSRMYDRRDLTLPYTDDNMVTITQSTYNRHISHITNTNQTRRRAQFNVPSAHSKRESIKNSAKARNIHFSLTTQRVQELLETKHCYFTGVELNHIQNDPNQLSFDRIDNEKGYTNENVVVCAKSFNTKKGELTVQEIIHLYNGVINYGIRTNDLTSDTETSILTTETNLTKDIDMEANITFDSNNEAVQRLAEMKKPVEVTQEQITGEYVIPADHVISLTKTTGVNVCDGLKQMENVMDTLVINMNKIYDGMKYIEELKGRLAELESNDTGLSIYTSEDNELSLFVQADTEDRIKQILITDVSDQIAGVELEIVDMFNIVKNLKTIPIIKNVINITKDIN